MKILAKHKSLRNIVIDRGWGLVQTNESELYKKAHLLEMRRGLNPLVFDISPSRNYNMSYFSKYYGNIVGSDWNANFYGVSIHCLIFVREHFPETIEKTEEMLFKLFDEIFSGNYKEWEKRGLR